MPGPGGADFPTARFGAGKTPARGAPLGGGAALVGRRNAPGPGVSRGLALMGHCLGGVYLLCHSRGRTRPALNINRKQVLAGKLQAGQARPLHLSNVLPCNNGTRPRSDRR